MKLDKFLNHVREQHDQDDFEEGGMSGTYESEWREFDKTLKELKRVVHAEMKIMIREFVGWFLCGLGLAAALVAFGFLIFGRK